MMTEFLAQTKDPPQTPARVSRTANPMQRSERKCPLSAGMRQNSDTSLGADFQSVSVVQGSLSPMTTALSPTQGVAQMSKESSANKKAASGQGRQIAALETQRNAYIAKNKSIFQQEKNARNTNPELVSQFAEQRAANAKEAGDFEDGLRPVPEMDAYKVNTAEDMGGYASQMLQEFGHLDPNKLTDKEIASQYLRLSNLDDQINAEMNTIFTSDSYWDERKDLKQNRGAVQDQLRQMQIKRPEYRTALDKRFKMISAKGTSKGWDKPAKK